MYYKLHLYEDPRPFQLLLLPCRPKTHIDWRGHGVLVYHISVLRSEIKALVLSLTVLSA